MPTNPDRLRPGARNVTAGGGVLFRRKNHGVEILLMRRRGLWDLPKGGIEHGESIEDGACREVQEETGCRSLRIIAPLGTTVHQYVESGVNITKKTWWYAMESDEPELNPQIEEEIDNLEWSNPDEAHQKVAFDNLREVISRFSRLMNEWNR